MPPTSTNPKTAGDKQTEHLIDLEKQVCRRAYELYEQRGREDGHALEDWLQAESELVQPKVKAAKS